ELLWGGLRFRLRRRSRRRLLRAGGLLRSRRGPRRGLDLGRGQVDGRRPALGLAARRHGPGLVITHWNSLASSADSPIRTGILEHCSDRRGTNLAAPLAYLPTVKDGGPARSAPPRWVAARPGHRPPRRRSGAPPPAATGRNGSAPGPR